MAETVLFGEIEQGATEITPQTFKTNLLSELTNNEIFRRDKKMAGFFKIYKQSNNPKDKNEIKKKLM